MLKPILRHASLFYTSSPAVRVPLHTALVSLYTARIEPSASWRSLILLYSCPLNILSPPRYFHSSPTLNSPPIESDNTPKPSSLLKHVKYNDRSPSPGNSVYRNPSFESALTASLARNHTSPHILSSKTNSAKGDANRLVKKLILPWNPHAQSSAPHTPKPDSVSHLPSNQSLLHWFFHCRALHVWISLGTLTSLVLITYLHKLRSWYSSSAAAASADPVAVLPVVSDLFWHPFVTIPLYIQAFRLYKLDESSKVSQKRIRAMQQAEKTLLQRQKSGESMGWLADTFGPVEPREPPPSQSASQQSA